jgi:hypothetical protein
LDSAIPIVRLRGLCGVSDISALDGRSHQLSLRSPILKEGCTRARQVLCDSPDVSHHQKAGALYTLPDPSKIFRDAYDFFAGDLFDNGQHLVRVIF